MFLKVTNLNNKIKIDISAGAAQLALALTRKLSINTIKIIGVENISKNLFSKSKLKFLKKTINEKTIIGPSIIICENINFKGS